MLRPYQQLCVDDALAFFDSGSTKRPLLVLPTGAGKSHVIAAIATQLGGKVLVLQPQAELLDQNYRKAVDAGFGDIVEIYSASAGEKKIGKITYATLGSIKKDAVANLFRGRVLIIDEAHLYPPREESMFQTFLTDSGITKVLGLTATPFRLKKGGTREDPYSQLNFLTRMRPGFFNQVLRVIQISEMVSGGWWTKMIYGEHPVVPDILNLFQSNTTGAEFSDESISRAMNSGQINQKIVARTFDALDSGRRFILTFTNTIQSAESIASKLAGKAKALHSKLPMKDRKHIVQSFRDGSLANVVNVGILGTGFDHPGLDCIMGGRPTMSLAVYYQGPGGGRGCRPDPTGRKKDCVVIDFVGNFRRFGKIENLSIENVPGWGWGIFNGTGKLLTNIRMDGAYGTTITRNNIRELKRLQAEYYKGLDVQ